MNNGCYDGAILPAFGTNQATHTCGCGAPPLGDGGSSFTSVLITVALGIAVALLARGSK